MNPIQLHSKFCRHCYHKTNGWIPMTPVFSKLALGDFGLIHHAQFKALGNIEQFPLNQQHSEPLILDAWHWQLESDIEKITSYNQDQQQNIIFKQKGDFIFHCSEPKASVLHNWSELKQPLTQNLTQLDYSFRQLYLINAIVKIDEWGLAIANADGAFLEWAVQTDENQLYSPNASLLQSQHIASFEKSAGRTAYFFKAKKLVLSEKIAEQLQRKHPNWSNAELINLIPAHQITVDNCLDYFDWVNATLDDIES